VRPDRQATGNTQAVPEDVLKLLFDTKLVKAEV
jgi:hypothetical protein